MEWGSNSPLWYGLLNAAGGVSHGGTQGAGLLGSIGYGLAAGANGMAQHQNMQSQQTLRAMQTAKMVADIKKSEQEQQSLANWQKIFGAPHTQPNPQGQATPVSMQASQGAPTPQAGPVGSVPEGLRPFIAAMGPEKGSAFLAQYLGQREPNEQWKDEAKGGVPGQTNTRTGQWKPLDPALTKITVNGPAPPVIQTEEDKALGQQYVKEYSGVVDAANAAENARNQIRMARAFSDTGSDGKELPSVLQQKAGNAAAALGMDVNSPAMKAILGRVSDGQSFVGTMQNLVLTKMQAQKGPQTETDAKRIEQTVASLGNTPEARDFLLRASDALAYEDILKRDFFDNHRTSKGTLGGASMQWRSFRNNVPFMGVSPNTGKPVFFAEFAEANRGKSSDAIIEAWKKQYGR